LKTLYEESQCVVKDIVTSGCKQCPIKLYHVVNSSTTKPKIFQASVDEYFQRLYWNCPGCKGKDVKEARDLFIITTCNGVDTYLSICGKSYYLVGCMISDCDRSHHVYYSESEKWYCLNWRAASFKESPVMVDESRINSEIVSSEGAMKKLLVYRRR